MTTLRRTVDTLLALVRAGDAPLDALVLPQAQAAWLALATAERSELLSIDAGRAAIALQWVKRRAILHTRWEDRAGWTCVTAELEELPVPSETPQPPAYEDAALQERVERVCKAMAAGSSDDIPPLLSPRHVEARTRDLGRDSLRAATPLLPLRGGPQRAAASVLFDGGAVGATWLLWERDEDWLLLTQTRHEAAANAWLDGRLHLEHPLAERPASPELDAWARQPELPGPDTPPLLQRAWSDFLLPPDPMLRRHVAGTAWVDELNAGVVYIEWRDDDTPHAWRTAIVAGPPTAPQLLATDTGADLERVYAVTCDIARKPHSG